MFDIIVEVSGCAYIEGESSDFEADFASVGFAAVIFGSSGGEFGDEVAVIQFAGHSPGKYPRGMLG